MAMGLHNHTAMTANVARLSSAALAECAMLDGVEASLPSCSEVAVELQATLDELRSAYAHAKCLQNEEQRRDLDACARQRQGSGSWQSCSREARTRRPTSATKPSLRPSSRPAKVRR